MEQLLIQENAAKNFLQASQDEVNILIPFNSEPIDVFMAAGNGSELEGLYERVEEQTPGGGTNMYSAIVEGLDLLYSFDLSDYTPAIILLTDGVNNRGEITPQTAAEIAKTYGVRVYTIGVGAMGTAPYPVMTPWGVDVQNVRVEIDEELLSEIAETTGGRYFRATDNTKLMEIYSEINKMEKDRTTIDSFPVYKELFGRYAFIALLALMLELVLKLFVIRRLP